MSKTNLVALLLLVACYSKAQNNNISFKVTMDDPASQVFRVEMNLRSTNPDSIVLKMPVWSPGYYQRLDYARSVQDMEVTDATGKKMEWSKSSDNSWSIRTRKGTSVRVRYGVKATRAFVANSILNKERAYIIPGSVFLYPDGGLHQPVSISIKPFNEWKDIATGLDGQAGNKFSLKAPDFDILFDSPILISNLDSLPSFRVQGVPHYFTGFKLGEFDKASFVEDLRKICEASAAIIGDVPFQHYTFIGIGPGQGGIEHLNSTTISFAGNGLKDHESRIRTLHFIAHEYFHHYNVKRIRPFELGPFDYDKGNRTNLLWIAEGLTVYYEYLVVKRAGISTEEELLNAIRSNIRAYEGKPGRLFQSLTQASYETWSDGPFGRTGDEVNKTISYYDKGPVVGTMLDFAIRNMTKNKRSLDDVMRTVYRKYYQEMKRGFTEAEFQSVAEEIAGGSLSELFEYTNTVKELNYPKYFGYAGLAIDTVQKSLPGAWIGVATRWRNDSLFITNVDYDSPAWKAGARNRNVITEIDGLKADANGLEKFLQAKSAGDNITLKLLQNGEAKSTTIATATRREASFLIRRIENPDALQAEILRDWAK